jgi:PASTA domain
MDSLDINVEVSGRYGMFSGEGKFGLANKASYNSASTFIVASCKVQNAFEMMDKFELTPEGKAALETPDKFKTAFGGEFYVVMQITSSSSSEQSKLSASLHASYQGLAVSGEVKASLEKASSSTTTKTTITTMMYQKSGQDQQLSLVNDPEAVIKRLKDFPTIARQNPCGYEVEVADYATLALSTPNPEEIADREMSLTDCAKLRLKYMQKRNDIEFARENRQFFEGLETDDVLSDLADKYTKAVSLVQLHAQKIAARSIPPTVFNIKEAAPELELPVWNCKRVNISSDIPVPNLISMSVEEAKQKLSDVGLVADISDSKAVDQNSTEPKNIVIAQNPTQGTILQPKASVRLTYNYVASEKFKWAGRGVLAGVELAKGVEIRNYAELIKPN